MSDKNKEPVRNTTESSVIGITGGIGSGKSRVCDFLKKYCQLSVINLDVICKELLMPDEPGWLALRNILSADFFNASGGLERKTFRNALFSDAGLRNRVDVVLHPLARLEMNKRVSLRDGPVLAEIPLLFEAGWQDDVQVIIVVYANNPVQLQRIIQRDHVSEEQAGKSVSAQQCLAEKALLADHVIDNSGDWRNTCMQLKQLVGVLGLEYRE